MVAMNTWPTDGGDGSVANEARWRKMARAYAPSAVIMGADTEMLPSLAGTNLTVRAGCCWVDGHFCELTSNQVLTVTANGLVVVRFDPVANTAELLYRDGATLPNQTLTGVYELPIAKIVASVMTDVRPLLSQMGSPLIYPNSSARLLVSANNEDGSLCVQADTANIYQFIGIQNSWRLAPWNAGRGLMGSGVYSSANINFSPTLTASAVQAVNLSRARTYMAFGTANVSSLSVSGVVDTISFGNSSATPIDKFQVTPANTSGFYGVSAFGIIQPTVDVSYGMRFYAQSSAGGTQSLVDIQSWIIDIGPNGDPTLLAKMAEDDTPTFDPDDDSPEGLAHWAELASQREDEDFGTPKTRTRRSRS